MSIQENLKEKREALGLSRYMVAKMAGIQANQLRLIEEGGDCMMSTAILIAKELGVKLDLI